LRDAVTHGYFKVGLKIAWKTIHADLRDVNIQLESAVSNMDAS